MLVDRVMRSNAVFLVSGFRYDAFFQIRKRNRKKLGNQCFPSAILIKAWRSVVWSVEQRFSSLGKLKQLKKNNRKLNQAFIARVPL